MSTSQSVADGFCKRCGASWKHEATQCWMCHGHERALEADEVHVADAADSTEPAERSQPIQFGLRSLLLVATLIAVLCSVTRVAPKVGIPLAVLCLLALLHTWYSTQNRRAEGESLSLLEQVLIFLGTLAFIFGVLVSVVAAFAITYFLTRAVGTSMTGAPGFILLVCIYGGIVALADAVVNFSFSSKTASGRERM